MKKLLLAGTAIGALTLAGPTLAADIPVKAPPAVAPVPVFTWTGCYIGGHGGFAAAQKYYEVPDFNGSPAFVGHIVGGELLVIHTGVTSFSHDPYGGFGGGQIGCQYQWDKWVIGIEGSGSGANIGGDSGGINLPLVAKGQSMTVHTRTDWFASVAAKFGYTGGRWLVYSKGGVAWDHTRFSAAGILGTERICIINDGCGPVVPNTLNLTASDTRTGWTTGVGIEFAATPNLTIFLEYDHYDFGKKTLHFNGTFCTLKGGCVTVQDALLDNKQRIDTIRLGFNWLFNWGKAPTPVVAKY